VAKDPAAAKSFEALVELPIRLWPENFRRQLEEVKDVVTRAGQPAAVPFARFRSWIPEFNELTRSKLKALSTALAGFGLGMEPDLRFGGAAPALDSRVVIFADHPASATEEARPQYLAAALTLQLAAAVAMADGTAGKAERTLISDQTQAWDRLSESERRRLQAFLRLLFTQPPKLSGLKKRIELLDNPAREAVGDFLVQVALADSDATPEEIRTLQRTFTLLGLDPEQVFSKVHAAVTSADTASRVPPQAPRSTGYTIPRPTETAPPRPPPSAAPRRSGIQLDPKKIAALQRDSERVATLLAKVFEAPEPIPEESVSPGLDPAEDQASDDLALGLDARHSSLLRALMARREWTRAEVEELVEDRELMIDGALERLNEASFESLDVPLFDGTDPIRLNPEAVEGVLSAHNSSP
jgi:uncharacterized tellurite resistance protein B-like protein